MKNFSIDTILNLCFVFLMCLFAYQTFAYEYDPNDVVETLSWIFILLGLVIYGIFTVFSLRWRIRKLEKINQIFADGALNARAKESNWQKIGTLNQSFNQMADKITNLIRSNRNLSRSVAHELRTPLFRIQWQAEILSETQLEKEQANIVANIIEDTEEITSLVNELLYYAKLENKEITYPTTSINCYTCICQQITHWRQETTKTITTHLDDKTSLVQFNDKQLKRVLNNLIHNAMRYAINNIDIRLTQNMQHKTVEITISNDGPDIPHQYREEIFKPFYSIDPARNKSTSGHGLGLAIVKEIIQKYNGTIFVQDKKSGGATFIIALPVIAKH